MKNKMRKLIRAWLKQRIVRISGFLIRLESEHRLAALRASFAHCGTTSVIRLPLHVEGAEHIAIGEEVSLNPFTHMWGGGGIEIGDRTMIASHVAISSLTHDPDSYEMYRSLIRKPVRIASDVWIGAHAVILPGVTIGRHAVVAAGTVVRDDVPEFAVVAGVPARLVRIKERPRDFVEVCGTKPLPAEDVIANALPRSL